MKVPLKLIIFNHSPTKNILNFIKKYQLAR